MNIPTEDPRLKVYAEGVIDGIKTTLRLVLAEGEGGVGEPCPQPLPSEIERWARDALARIEEETA